MFDESAGVSVNGGYREGQCTAFPMNAQNELRLALETSASTFLSSTCMLAATRHGRLVTVNLLVSRLID